MFNISLNVKKLCSVLIITVFLAGNAVAIASSYFFNQTAIESIGSSKVKEEEAYSENLLPHAVEQTQTLAREYAARDLMEIFGVKRSVAKEVVHWVFEAQEIQQTNLPLDLIFSVIAVESSFKYDAISSSGAVSLMQVKPKYWANVCAGDLMNPRDNVHCGISILDQYVNQYCDGNIACGIQSYNVGPTGYYEPENEMAKQRYLKKVTDARLKLADSIAML